MAAVWALFHTRDLKSFRLEHRADSRGLIPLNFDRSPLDRSPASTGGADFFCDLPDDGFRQVSCEIVDDNDGFTTPMGGFPAKDHASHFPNPSGRILGGRSCGGVCGYPGGWLRKLWKPGKGRGRGRELLLGGVGVDAFFHGVPIRDDSGKYNRRGISWNAKVSLRDFLHRLGENRGKACLVLLGSHANALFTIHPVRDILPR